MKSDTCILSGVSEKRESRQNTIAVVYERTYLIYIVFSAAKYVKPIKS